MSELPGDLKYTKEHEWLRQEEDGSVTIGITGRRWQRHDWHNRSRAECVG